MKLKIKREIDELCFKPIIVSIDDMDKLERKKMRRKNLLKTLGMMVN